MCLRTTVFTFVVLGTATVECAGQSPGPSGVAADTSLGSRVDAFLAPYVEEGLWSGAVVVVLGDSVLHAKGYGLASIEHGVPNTTRTRFPVASVTKAFTAIAAARLWREGVIDRDATIDRWLPAFPRGDRITVAHLVGHRSGIPDTDDLSWFALGQRMPHSIDELVDSLAAAEPEFAPGERYSYSNGGYTVLAAVLAAATGVDFADVLQSRVFGPAGMTRSGSGAASGVINGLASGYTLGVAGELVPGPWVHPSNKVGAGSAYSTVEDLVAFHRALRDDRLLPRATRDSLFRAIDSPLGGERLYFGGRGPSYTASLQIFDDAERNGMVAALGNNYGRLNEEITDGLAALLFGSWEDERIGEIVGRRLPFMPVVLPDQQLERLPGRYRHQWGFEFTLEREGDRIVYVDPEHRTRTPVIPVADGVLITPWQWAELRMTDDGGFQWTWLDFPERPSTVERIDGVGARAEAAP